MSRTFALEKVKKHIEKSIVLMEFDMYAQINIIEEKHPAVASFMSNHITQYKFSEYIEIIRILLMVYFCFEKKKYCKEITQDLLDDITAANFSMLKYVHKDPEQIQLVAKTIFKNTYALEILAGASFMIYTSNILLKMSQTKISQILLDVKILIEAFEKCCINNTD
jgi:hypothetical protein